MGLSEHLRGQTVRAGSAGRNIFKTAAVVGVSWSAEVSIYQRWSKGGPLGSQVD